MSTLLNVELILLQRRSRCRLQVGTRYAHAPLCLLTVLLHPCWRARGSRSEGARQTRDSQIYRDVRVSRTRGLTVSSNLRGIMSLPLLEQFYFLHMRWVGVLQFACQLKLIYIEQLVMICVSKVRIVFYFIYLFISTDKIVHKYKYK